MNVGCTAAVAADYRGQRFDSNGVLRKDRLYLLTLGDYRYNGLLGWPESAPAVFACGTDAPGWLDGAHPAPEEGAVDRTVCFNWSGNECSWSASIEVLNCGAFYLYHLPVPSQCALRYCGETPPPPM